MFWDVSMFNCASFPFSKTWFVVWKNCWWAAAGEPWGTVTWKWEIQHPTFPKTFRNPKISTHPLIKQNVRDLLHPELKLDHTLFRNLLQLLPTDPGKDDLRWRGRGQDPVWPETWPLPCRRRLILSRTTFHRTANPFLSISHLARPFQKGGDFRIEKSALGEWFAGSLSLKDGKDGGIQVRL